MQFHIQLIIACTIDQTQGLTFDHLTFDPNGIYKHALTFITLSHIKNKKENLLQLLQMIFFQIDLSVFIEMHRLQTLA
jgi:hypothetical protein